METGENTIRYFSLDEAREEIKKRWANVELKKKILAVKTDRENTSPDALLGVGATWAMSFIYEAISKAIDNA